MLRSLWNGVGSDDSAITISNSMNITTSTASRWRLGIIVIVATR
jgi:hypothetical protein